MRDLNRYEDIGLGRVDPGVVLSVASEFKGLPVEVLTSKLEVAPSGDLHDYYSWAPYVWLEGGSRVRKDGRVNPEIYKYDKPRLVVFAHAVKFLGAAFQLTRDGSFAEKAREWICAWMVDPDTSMSPHMMYAQSAPYQGALSEGGIIEARRFIWVSRVARELEAERMFRVVESEAVREWFRRFLDWLLVSPQGVAEGRASNNHGTWYDALILSLARFLGREALVSLVLAAFPGRIVVQMGEDGSFPLEMRRADPSHYVKFNFQAMLAVMEVGFGNA